MKRLTKKILTSMLILAMLVSIGGMSQSVKMASAKSWKKGGPLVEEDFNVKGKYGVKVKKKNWHYWNIVGEKEPTKCIKTARGITLLSSRKQVEKMYGSPIYEAKATQKRFDAAYLKKITKHKESRKFTFNKKVDIYGYEASWKMNEDAWIYFCFKDDKVIAAYFVRYVN